VNRGERTSGELVEDEVRTDQAAQLLAKTRLFANLGDDARMALAAAVLDRVYKRGQLIFHQGDRGEALFIVVEGLVKVFVTSEEGDEMVLVTLGPNEVFGELSLVDGGTRSASAEAVEKTRLLALSRSTLLSLLAESPQWTEALLRSLGEALRRLTEQASDLVFLDLHGRVAKLILGMARPAASGDGAAVVLDLHLTQTDLAAMVGGSRQSVNQILHAFERRGYLEVRGRHIAINDLEALRRRAGM
jgi:CRP/FNR family transcriptional regulator, cyclic AMP receptor protein